MRASRWLVVLVCVLPMLATTAFSQVPSTDIIGVFFDEQGYLPCGFQLPYTTLTAYVLAIDISEPSGLSGWECSLVTDPATFASGVTVTLANGGVNALTEPDFDVTLPAVVPRAPIIKLATWSAFYIGGVVKYGIGPAHPGHFPDDPGAGYAAGDDPARRMRLRMRCGDAAPQPDTYYAAVMGMGCPTIKDLGSCLTPVEDATWGAVKQLYR